jgi:hypothetical protein
VAIGPFRIDEASGSDEEPTIRSLLEALLRLPGICETVVDSCHVSAIRNGVRLSDSDLQPCDGTTVLTHGGEILALATWAEQRLAYDVVFPEDKA